MGVKGCQGEDKSGQGSSSEIPMSTFLHPGSETQPLRSVGSGDDPVCQSAPALVTLTVRSLRISGDFLAICSPMQWHGNKAPDCPGHSPGSVPYFIGVYLTFPCLYFPHQTSGPTSEGCYECISSNMENIIILLSFCLRSCCFLPFGLCSQYLFSLGQIIQLF